MRKLCLDDISERNNVMTEASLCSSEDDRIRSDSRFPQLVQDAKLCRNSSNSKDEAMVKVLLHLGTLLKGRKDHDNWELLLFG